MNTKIYEYDAIIIADDKSGGAFVPFPYDVRAEFGKGRVKVHATFDGEPYDGSIVNMGVKNEDGTVCYIIGILKEIRAKIGKQPGDSVKVTIQEHCCMPITVIDEYINEQPEAVRPILVKVRETIRAAAPDAVEKISWRMPTFWQGENLIHFAAFKKHIGIYPGDLTPTPFADRLDGYRHTKGTIQFPLDKPVDYDLIAEITRYRVEVASKKRM